ncbi:MAG TPA: tetratricopeptide repeat protein, partial [Gemmatimonadaceae bacterium]|nr:tetratricopeptide repeat protein [Gemmatimonadaceae bacterium]
QYMQNPRRYFVPLANEYRSAGDFDRAISLCREHLPQQPGHMSGHIVLGRAYYEKGDVGAAREVFLTSVSLDDENLIALRLLGDIARAANAPEDARQWYARVLDADPENREIEQLLRSLEPSPVAAPEDAASADQQPLVFAPGDRDAAPESALAGALSSMEPLEPAFDAGALEMPPTHDAAHDPQLSALADPTPPGLRAIVGEVEPTSPELERPRPSDERHVVVPRTLGTLDLSTLDDLELTTPEPHTAVPGVDEGAAGGEIEMLDVEPTIGGGFALDDLDGFSAELGTLSPPEPEVQLHDEHSAAPSVDEPALVTSASTAAPVELPPVATPMDNSAIDSAPALPGDELMSRPGFGALASFASWRSQQERNTPAHGVPRTPPAPVAAVSVEAEDSPDDESLFWSAGSEGTATAPEFVTETMAALYAQQGFTQQAVDVYRALLSREPDNVTLQHKVSDLEAVLASAEAQSSLDADADKALQFSDLHEPSSSRTDQPSVLEAMYMSSPPIVPTDDLLTEFDSTWSATPDNASRPDDWFASERDDDPIVASDSFTGSGLFGLPEPGLGDDDANPFGFVGARVPAGDGGAAVLDTVFGTPVISASDGAAGEMLLRMAAQMVGRLPKEAPTLPVPDVLELPSPATGDAAPGSTPAPLLSFDRFFSGSGSPPRARIETPRGASSSARPPAATNPPSPSLSPTFGGVPVIPPSTSVPSPTWAGFDQFLPPKPAATPPEPTGTDMRPAPTPPPTEQPSSQTPWGTPKIDRVDVPGPGSVVPAVSAAPMETPAEAPVGERREAPVSSPDSAQTTAPQPARPAPSEFHRWLEGLS